MRLSVKTGSCLCGRMLGLWGVLILPCALALLSLNRPFECVQELNGHTHCNFYQACFDQAQQLYIITNDVKRSSRAMFSNAYEDENDLSPSVTKKTPWERIRMAYPPDIEKPKFETPQWLEQQRNDPNVTIHDFPPGTIFLYSSNVFYHVYHGGQLMLGTWDLILTRLGILGTEVNYPPPRALYYLGCCLDHQKTDLKYGTGLLEVFASALLPMTDAELARLAPADVPARSALLAKLRNSTKLQLYRNLTHEIFHPLLFLPHNLIRKNEQKKSLVCLTYSATANFAMFTTVNAVARYVFMKHTRELYGVPKDFKQTEHHVTWQNLKFAFYSAGQHRSIPVTIITRPQSRAIRNVQEIVDALHFYNQSQNPFAVTLVTDLGDKSFAEQITLFADASIVISSHGAELGNIYFMQKPSCIIEVIPAGFLHSERQQFNGMAHGADVIHYPFRGLPFGWNFSQHCPKKWLDDHLSAESDVECFHKQFKHSQMIVNVTGLMELVGKCVIELGTELGRGMPKNIKTQTKVSLVE
eukprot:g41597.t1